MEFDIKSLFSGTRDIDVTVEPMDFPFLASYAFDAQKDNAFVPSALISVLHRACQMIAVQTGPDPLKDRMERSIKTAVSLIGGWPNGFFGTDNLPVGEISRLRHSTSVIVGMTGAKIGLRRYGDCLAIRATDGNDKPHEEMMAILAKLAAADDGLNFLQEFTHRYGFSCTPTLKSCQDGWKFSLQDELAVMRSYLPDIAWSRRTDLVVTLVRNFIKDRSGICLGSYGDASVYLRIIFDRGTDDSTWRQGLVAGHTDREITFRSSSNIRPRVEYFIRTIDGNNPYQDSPLGINYNYEQYALRELARMIYTALYQRMHQHRVDGGNPHLIRFRRELEKTTTAA